MRWSVAMCLGTALALSVCGCRGAGARRDLVESELRAREEDVRTLREDLERSEFQNQMLSRELSAVKGLPGPNGVIEKPSEPYPVRSLTLGRQTGGRHADDSSGGDDALIVQIEPKDNEGQAIKAPGRVTVEALEITPDGTKRPLSLWEVPPEVLRKNWQNGLLTTGYVLTLVWKVPPSTDKLRVVARFFMLNGRVLEADKDITVRLPPGGARRVIVSPPPGTVIGADPLPPVPGVPATPTPTTPSPAPPQTELPPPLPVSPVPAPTPEEEKKTAPPTPKKEPDKKKPEKKEPAPKSPFPPAPSPTSENEGPILSRARKPGPAVQMLRPVPLPAGAPVVVIVGGAQ